MTKTELVEAVAAKAEMTKKDTDKAVTAILGAITEELSKKGSVSIVGFGVFGVKERAEREARNLRTGETMTIPATTIPFFKAGKGLKDAVK